MRYVIIGNSAAGLSAAETIRNNDTTGEITIISDESCPAYSRCLSTYHLGGRLPREQLFIKNQDYYKKNSFSLKYGLVTGVKTKENQLDLSTGEKIFYDRLLIASGGEPVIPEIPGVEGEGIYPLRTIADLDGIVCTLDRVKEAVILGDGLVSITTAQALLQRGVKVSVAGIAGYILAQFLDAASAAMLEAKLKDSGVNLELKNSISEVLLDSNRQVRGVRLSDGRELPAQLLIIAVGVRPRISFLSGSGIVCDHGILADNHLETSVPGVFAAGDAVQAADLLRGKPLINPLWPNAVEQGGIAGANMCGMKKVYPGSCNMNSVNIAGISVIAAGITTPADSVCEEYVDDRKAYNIYNKLVFRDDRLIGFLLSGNTSNAGILLSLLKEQNPLGAKKAELLAGRNYYAKLSGLKNISIL